MAWIHVKALRAFVESVLRYGLPVTFQAMLLRPQRKAAKCLQEELNKLYKHLDVSLAGTGSHDVSTAVLLAEARLDLCKCTFDWLAMVELCLGGGYTGSEYGPS